MIPNKEKEGWYYHAVEKLSALLHGISLKHNGDFIVWIAFILLFSFTENKALLEQKSM